jgi:hypothetical protein
LVRLHLCTCFWCARYKKQIGIVDEAVQTSASQAEKETELSNRLTDEAREKIIKALKKGKD